MAEAALAQMTVVLWRSPAAGQVQECQVPLPEGACVQDALQAAGWPLEQPCGVWGRVCTLEHALRDGDRVELYRPLTVDPKVARRQRFVQQGARATGLFAQRRPHSKAGY